MSSRLTPQCTECLRNYAYGFLKEARRTLGAIEHVRGKKKTTTKGPLTIPVRLLKDFPAFGKKGAIVPVPAGRMRNIFFPMRVAAYMTMDEQRLLKRDKTLIERDYSFGKKIEEIVFEETISTNPEVKPEVIVQEPKPKVIEIPSIAPERGMELVEIFIPKTLDFYREVITEDTQPGKSLGMAGVAAELFQARNQALRAQAPKSIYGSVSTLDIYQAIKAAMATNDESARVVIAEEDIVLDVKDNDDDSKLKHLGTYKYTIQLKGAAEVINRTVRVLAQDA